MQFKIKILQLRLFMDILQLMHGKICMKKGVIFFGEIMNLQVKLLLCMLFNVMDECHMKQVFAVIGKGNTARGAMKVLNMLGAEVMQYDRKTEQLFRDEIGKFDVVVNCVLWDIERSDHIVFKEDLKRMKKNAMIIDVSCDRHGGIETSVPTTFEDPTYMIDGVMHYVVDHTPALFHKTFTYNNSEVIFPYIDMLIVDKPNKILKKALIFENGKIIDLRINTYQNRQF